MATLSRTTTQYRDGVFSNSAPAPRYGQLLTSFEDGSLGSLDEDAAADLDPALAHVIQSLQPDGLQSRALPPAAMAAAAVAVALAEQARAATDTSTKIVLAIATSYSATFFGLPRNDLAYVIDQVCGMFAMTAAQRRDYHQQAARVLDQFVASLKKGNPMSGVFKDGVLGDAYRDGSLGILMHQPGSVRDGSLGAVMYQNHAFRDGSLGLNRMVTDPRQQKRGRRGHYMNMRGLSGGCGCSGVGDDAAVVVSTPFYKKPLVIGGAAIALGVVLYAVSRRWVAAPGDLVSASGRWLDYWSRWVRCSPTLRVAPTGCTRAFGVS